MISSTTIWLGLGWRRYEQAAYKSVNDAVRYQSKDETAYAIFHPLSIACMQVATRLLQPSTRISLMNTNSLTLTLRGFAPYTTYIKYLTCPPLFSEGLEQHFVAIIGVQEAADKKNVQYFSLISFLCQAGLHSSVRKLRESQGFRKKCTGPSACQPKMTMALAQLWVTITPSATSRPVFVFLIGAGGAPRSVIDVSFRRALFVHFALVLEGELTRHLVDSLAAWNLQKEKGVDCIAFESKKVFFTASTLLITDRIAFVNLAQGELFSGTVCIPPLEISAS